MQVAVFWKRTRGVHLVEIAYHVMTSSSGAAKGHSNAREASERNQGSQYERNNAMKTFSRLTIRYMCIHVFLSYPSRIFTLGVLERPICNAPYNREEVTRVEKCRPWRAYFPHDTLTKLQIYTQGSWLYI